MKVLYGVQATGNGHISRARLLLPELKRLGVQVDFLFSGRKKSKFFDMDAFGDYKIRQGLTFSTKGGKIDPGATFFNANFAKLAYDIQALDVSSYDLVLSDFEPITGWAARVADKRMVGIGHQYAFRFPIPHVQGSLIDQLVLQNFAPATTFCALHYHHFGSPILPPMVSPKAYEDSTPEAFTLVYLPFESKSTIAKFLRQFRQMNFVVYHPECKEAYRVGNVDWRPPSSTGFPKALGNCQRVLCNAGFMLTSEVIMLGKPLIVKPLSGQPEQLSNALALEKLGLGVQMKNFDKSLFDLWLRVPEPNKTMTYPDTAREVAHWIANDCEEPIGQFARRIWDSVGQ